MSKSYAGFLFSSLCLFLAMPLMAEEIRSMGEQSGYPLDRNPSEFLDAENAGRKVTLSEIFAKADLEPRSDSGTSGTVEFKRTKNAVIVVMNVTNAKPGKHGIHIHEKGDCSAKDAASAGEHYNPKGYIHASPFANRAHFGDLGNVTVNSNRTGTTTLTIPRKDSNMVSDWQNIIGKAVVLHEKEDDFKTQPSGNSGNRIACGVIKAVSNVTAH